LREENEIHRERRARTVRLYRQMCLCEGVCGFAPDERLSAYAVNARATVIEVVVTVEQDLDQSQ
jgi:hypothetical protein